MELRKRLAGGRVDRRVGVVTERLDSEAGGRCREGAESRGVVPEYVGAYWRGQRDHGGAAGRRDSAICISRRARLFWKECSQRSPAASPPPARLRCRMWPARIPPRDHRGNVPYLSAGPGGPAPPRSRGQRYHVGLFRPRRCNFAPIVPPSHLAKSSPSLFLRPQSCGMVCAAAANEKGGS